MLDTIAIDTKETTVRGWQCHRTPSYYHKADFMLCQRGPEEYKDPTLHVVAGIADDTLGAKPRIQTLLTSTSSVGSIAVP